MGLAVEVDNMEDLCNLMSNNIVNESKIIDMKRYRMIDKRDRDTHEELKEYTLQELKEYFEPNKEDFPELHKLWEQVKNLYDLKEYLKAEADGMKVPYEFEEM